MRAWVHSLWIGLAALTGAGPAAAQRTAITVHVDTDTVRRESLTIQYSNVKVRFQPGQSASSSRYRTYVASIEWPADRQFRRNDFELYARVQNSDETSFYLRLANTVPSVELFLFNPRPRECSRQPVAESRTDEALFQQIAIAEAMI